MGALVRRGSVSRYNQTLADSSSDGFIVGLLGVYGFILGLQHSWPSCWYRRPMTFWRSSDCGIILMLSTRRCGTGIWCSLVETDTVFVCYLLVLVALLLLVLVSFAVGKMFVQTRKTFQRRTSSCHVHWRKSRSRRTSEVIFLTATWVVKLSR